MIKSFNQFRQQVNESGAIAPLSSLDSNQYFKALPGDVTLGDRLPKELFDDLEAAGRAANVRVLATTAESDHRGIHDSFSRHNKGQALDLSKIGWATTDWNSLPGSGGGTQSNYRSKQDGEDGARAKEFFDAADALVGELINRGYKLITQDDELRDKYSSSIVGGESGPKAIIWKYTSSRAGNHYNHIHISNTSAEGAAADEVPGAGTTVVSGGSAAAVTLIDSDLITRLISKLKEKNFSQEDLKKFSKAITAGSAGQVSVDTTEFNKIAEMIIDKLEGGYYHPDMLEDGRIKDSRYSASGETMMGIDRKAGGTINETPEGIEFWDLIDKAGARESWKWGYRGGELEPKLRALASKMIQNNYEKYSAKYLSPKSLEIVNTDPKLLFNFVYSVWNGPGWFQTFAKVVNDKVSAGETDPVDLAKEVISARINSGNSLVAQGGRKIDDILGTNFA